VVRGNAILPLHVAEQVRLVVVADASHRVLPRRVDVDDYIK
jgi:pyrimidine operon attenuation protein/uracil phosphoribosyltransferase